MESVEVRPQSLEPLRNNMEAKIFFLVTKKVIKFVIDKRDMMYYFHEIYVVTVNKNVNSIRYWLVIIPLNLLFA